MADRLHLPERHRRTLEALLREHLPDVEVWAYGSRVNGRSHDGSDLDLVLRGPGLEKIPVERLGAFADAVYDSSIPFLVEARDWARLPGRFLSEIGKDHVILAIAKVESVSSGDSATPPKWTQLNLGQVCSKIGSGATPRGGKDVYLPHGPYALIRSQNVLNAGFRDEGLAYITGEHASQLQNVEVAEGDVLLNITGDSVARVCQVPPDVLPARVNQHVAIVRPDPEKLDSRFLRYALVSPKMQTKLLSWAGSGATRNALTKGMIESLGVAAPCDVCEQRAVAHILGTLDDKIELNRRTNETLEAMARALFNSWFVDFEPVRAKMAGRDTGLPDHVAGLFPRRLNGEGLPEGWRFSEIGREVRVVGGTTPSTKEPSLWDGGEHHWATPKDLSRLQSPVLLDTDRKITDAGVDKISSGLLPVGTVLMSSRAPIGYLAIAGVPTAVNQGFIAMVCEGLLPNVFVLLWCEHQLDYIKGIAGGSTFAEISKQAFRPAPVVIPPPEILLAFSSVTGSIFDRLVANGREDISLARTRDLMLPRLLSGELRVPDAESIVEAVA